MVQSVLQRGGGILRAREVVGGLDGGDISSDGEVLPAEAERQLRLIVELVAAIDDEREPTRVCHNMEDVFSSASSPSPAAMRTATTLTVARRPDLYAGGSAAFGAQSSVGVRRRWCARSCAR